METKNKKSAEKTEAAVRKNRAKKKEDAAKTASAKKKENTARKSDSTAKTGASVSGNRKKSAGSAAQEPVRASRRREIDVPDIRRAPGTPVLAEVCLWILIALCLILFLNNIFAFGVTALDAVSGFFFGVFGVCAYLAPILLVFLAAFIVANRASLPSWVKSGAIFIFFLCICAFTELLSGSFDAARSFSDYYAAGRDFRAGGGAAGALLCRIFCPLFGQIGAWILLIVLIIICAVIITERSLFDGLRKGSSRAYRRARADSRAKKELHDLKKEKKQLTKQRQMQAEIDRLRSGEGEVELEVRRPRRANVISGVTENTRLDPHLSAPEEIHEVVPHIYRRGEAADAPAEPKETVSRRRHVSDAQAGQPGDAMQPENTQPEAVPAARSNRAKKMVDSVNPQKPKQMDLNFTIQRDGVSEPVELPAFSGAEL